MNTTIHQQLEQEDQQEQPAVVNSSRSEYMREYMRNRYINSRKSANAYRNSCRIKQKLGNLLTTEEINKYGIYLADVLKLKNIISSLPADLLAIVIQETATI